MLTPKITGSLALLLLVLFSDCLRHGDFTPLFQGIFKLIFIGRDGGLKVNLLRKYFILAVYMSLSLYYFLELFVVPDQDFL